MFFRKMFIVADLVTLTDQKLIIMVIAKSVEDHPVNISAKLSRNLIIYFRADINFITYKPVM